MIEFFHEEPGSFDVLLCGTNIAAYGITRELAIKRLVASACEYLLLSYPGLIGWRHRRPREVKRVKAFLTTKSPQEIREACLFEAPSGGVQYRVRRAMKYGGKR